MRIGVMLRALDERQGIGVYSRNLIEHLLELDTTNEYVLFYARKSLLGTFADRPNVTERFVWGPNKAFWDQVMIPVAARRAAVDVIFHTKFTVPFLTRRPSVMAVHGASWYVHPELYSKLGILYIRCLMPLYFRKARAILSNSELTTRDFIRILHVAQDKIHTARLAAADHFRPITDGEVLADVARRYSLPSRFILSVVKYDPRKNMHNLMEAFRLCHEKTPCKLVVIGIGCEKYRTECRLVEHGIDSDVRFLGWVSHVDLVAIYNLAEFLFFPSVYEEFGIPTCEAMACGCPTVVSTTGALPELAGDSGLLVDPTDPPAMAEALRLLWTDAALRDRLSANALERSSLFSWKLCAEETLRVLSRVGQVRSTKSA